MLVVSVISSRMLLLAALFFHPYSYLLQGASASIVKRVPHQRRLCPYSRNCTIVSWTAKIEITESPNKVRHSYRRTVEAGSQVERRYNMHTVRVETASFLFTFPLHYMHPPDSDHADHLTQLACPLSDGDRRSTSLATGLLRAKGATDGNLPRSGFM